MLIVEESVLVQQPPEEVWKQLTQPAHFTKWMRNAIEYDADWDEEPRVGDRYRVLEKVAWRRFEGVGEVIRVVPGESYTSRSVQAPFPVENTWRVEAAGNDTLLVFHGETPGPGGLVGKVSGPILARAFGRSMRANLRRLKALIENT